MTRSARIRQERQGIRWLVVGEIAIGEDRFIVLADEVASKNRIGTTEAAQRAEAARFTLNGRTCSVVPAIEPELPDPVRLLTARELQIAVLVGQGHQTKQIAHKLHISEWTVSTHLRRMFAKLGVDNRAAMVCRCLRLIERSLIESALNQVSGNLAQVFGPGSRDCRPAEAAGVQKVPSH